MFSRPRFSFNIHYNTYISRKLLFRVGEYIYILYINAHKLNRNIYLHDNNMIMYHIILCIYYLYYIILYIIYFEKCYAHVIVVKSSFLVSLLIQYFLLNIYWECGFDISRGHVCVIVIIYIIRGTRTNLSERNYCNESRKLIATHVNNMWYITFLANRIGRI